MSSNQQYADAFNEWMRRFTETPEDFQREFQAVQEYNNNPEDYGASMAAYFTSLLV